MEEPRNSPFRSSNDRISNLPENLIHHIMSFMDMTYVVQTCVLSKRWKHLWIITPILNFDFNEFSLAIKNNQSNGTLYQKFIKFVDQVFILRDSSNIQRVNLVCGKQWNFDVSVMTGSLTTWILLDWLYCFCQSSLQFSNLRFIKLEAFLSRAGIRALGWLFYMSPNVESLLVVITGMPTSDIPDSEDYWAGVSPDHLRSVEIRGLTGHFNNELKFVEILFKKAVILENMQIHATIVKTSSPHDYSFQLSKSSLLFLATVVVSYTLISYFRKFKTQICFSTTPPGFDSNQFVLTTLLNMYSLCGRNSRAFTQVFDEMPVKGVVSWNIMISGHLRHGELELARRYFDMAPDKSLVSWNSMVAGYANSGNMMEAERLFMEMPTASWNSLISGYVKVRDALSAERVFERMTGFLDARDKSCQRAFTCYQQQPVLRITISLFHQICGASFILCDNSNIQKVNFVCGIEMNFFIDISIMTASLTNWIVAAVRRNIQELYLDISGVEISRFPQCFFTCTSLIKLELKLGGNSSIIVLPSSIDFPRLTFMKLDSLPSTDVNLTNRLFSKCHVLECLIIKGRLGHMDLQISSLTLKHLTIFDLVSKTSSKVKIDAPNLVSFKCEDYISKCYVLKNLASLVTADIYLRATNDEASKKKDYTKNHLLFLKALSNAKEIRLSHWFLHMGFLAASRKNSLQFSNLGLVKLKSYLPKHMIQALGWFLRISPNVESLQY
ncbi:uncharacterized protein LOC113349005 [Papaver somniferum]|uniref:uncharacterized protein LOC113349005 n=1 Tax=Papaver somniferum TaxID=3469 RepID=UPI000E6FAE3C|nr:uncharacterized protein LOC113349005 [Papaver somniferum]